MVCPPVPGGTYKELGPRLREKARADRTPLTVTMEITYRCNVRCVHCYIGDQRSSTPDKELSLREIKGIIDQIVDEGTLWFLITGGEPFVRPDVLEIVEYARRKGLLPILYTNGALLNRERVARMADFPPFYTEISLYGLSEQTYQKVTSVRGAYKKVIQGIELLKEYHIPFKLKTMVLTINRHELAGMIEFASQLGAPFRYDFKVNSELNSSAHPHQYRLSPEDSLAVELADPGSVETGIRLAKEENSGGAFGRKLLYNCGGGLSTFHINPYGQMSVCITARAQAYDLRSGTVRDGWRDFIYKVRMQPLSSQSLCATCSISLFCKQCPGWAELEHGDPHKPVEYLCKLAQLRSQVFLKMIE